MANDIQVTIENEGVEASICNNNLDINLHENHIDASVIKESLETTIENEEICVEIEGAIVNYTGVLLQDRHEIFELDINNITNKNINLSNTPTGNIFLIIESANMQIEDRSWVLNGSSISWAGKDIENLLEIGDVISVKYKVQ